MLPILLGVKKRRWRWIGHVNRMPPTSIPRVTMRWTPAGNRRKERPKETRRRSVEREMKALGWIWAQAAKLAADRIRWRSSVSAKMSSYSVSVLPFAFLMTLRLGWRLAINWARVRIPQVCYRFEDWAFSFSPLTPLLTQLYKWVPGYRQWWKCESISSCA